MDLLLRAYDKAELSFKGKLNSIRGKKNFAALLGPLYNKAWVVNIQKPFAHPQKVLEYLSCYVFRSAISDRRIDKVEGGKVHFSVKDYKLNGIFRKMKLNVDEFIRRFLRHVLPQRFLKVRYYGIFTNTRRKENIKKAYELVAEEQEGQKQEDIEAGKQVWEKQETIWTEIMGQLIKNKTQLPCL